ncbi:MAG: hypothetical protein QXD84_00535 [Thermoplasmata archaeon]
MVESRLRKRGVPLVSTNLAPQCLHWNLWRPRAVPAAPDDVLSLALEVVSAVRVLADEF